MRRSAWPSLPISSSCTSRRPTRSRAVVVEPIQGEGGYIVPPPAFLQGLRELTLSSTGSCSSWTKCSPAWAGPERCSRSDHFGLKADIVNIAKGIASGLPLGVTCARADVMTWPPGAHASTFGGNPVACAAANATIKLLKESLVANAAAVGAHLMAGIRALQDKHPLIGDVRGKGLMIGVELVRDRQTKVRAVEERNALVQAMFRRGVLLLGAGRNALRLAPPLVLSIAQADSVLARDGRRRWRKSPDVVEASCVASGRQPDPLNCAAALAPTRIPAPGSRFAASGRLS